MGRVLNKSKREAEAILGCYARQLEWLLGLVNLYRKKLGMARLVLTESTAEGQRTQRETICQKKSQADK